MFTVLSWREWLRQPKVERFDAPSPVAVEDYCQHHMPDNHTAFVFDCTDRPMVQCLAHAWQGRFSNKQLVEIYNSLTEESGNVRKFKDRENALSQIAYQLTHLSKQSVPRLLTQKDTTMDTTQHIGNTAPHIGQTAPHIGQTDTTNGAATEAPDTNAEAAEAKAATTAPEGDTTNTEGDTNTAPVGDTTTAADPAADAAAAAAQKKAESPAELKKQAAAQKKAEAAEAKVKKEADKAAAKKAKEEEAAAKKAKETKSPGVITSIMGLLTSGRKHTVDELYEALSKQFPDRGEGMKTTVRIQLVRLQKEGKLVVHSEDRVDSEGKKVAGKNYWGEAVPAAK